MLTPPDRKNACIRISFTCPRCSTGDEASVSYAILASKEGRKEIHRQASGTTMERRKLHEQGNETAMENQEHPSKVDSTPKILDVEREVVMTDRDQIEVCFIHPGSKNDHHKEGGLIASNCHKSDWQVCLNCCTETDEDESYTDSYSDSSTGWQSSPTCSEESSTESDTETSENRQGFSTDSEEATSSGFWGSDEISSLFCDENPGTLDAKVTHNTDKLMAQGFPCDEKKEFSLGSIKEVQVRSLNADTKTESQPQSSEVQLESLSDLGESLSACNEIEIKDHCRSVIVTQQSESSYTFGVKNDGREHVLLGESGAVESSNKKTEQAEVTRTCRNDEYSRSSVETKPLVCSKTLESLSGFYDREIVVDETDLCKEAASQSTKSCKKIKGPQREDRKVAKYGENDDDQLNTEIEIVGQEIATTCEKVEDSQQATAEPSSHSGLEASFGGCNGIESCNSMPENRFECCTELDGICKIEWNVPTRCRVLRGNGHFFLEYEQLKATDGIENSDSDNVSLEGEQLYQVPDQHRENQNVSKANDDKLLNLPESFNQNRSPGTTRLEEPSLLYRSCSTSQLFVSECNAEVTETVCEEVVTCHSQNKGEITSGSFSEEDLTMLDQATVNTSSKENSLANHRGCINVLEKREVEIQTRLKYLNQLVSSRIDIAQSPKKAQRLLQTNGEIKQNIEAQTSASNESDNVFDSLSYKTAMRESNDKDCLDNKTKDHDKPYSNVAIGSNLTNNSICSDDVDDNSENISTSHRNKSDIDLEGNERKDESLGCPEESLDIGGKNWNPEESWIGLPKESLGFYEENMRPNESWSESTNLEWSNGCPEERWVEPPELALSFVCERAWPEESWIIPLTESLDINGVIESPKERLDAPPEESFNINEMKEFAEEGIGNLPEFPEESWTDLPEFPEKSWTNLPEFPKESWGNLSVKSFDINRMKEGWRSQPPELFEIDERKEFLEESWGSPPIESCDINEMKEVSEGSWGYSPNGCEFCWEETDIHHEQLVIKEWSTSFNETQNDGICNDDLTDLELRDLFSNDESESWKMDPNPMECCSNEHFQQKSRQSTSSRNGLDSEGDVLTRKSSNSLNNFESFEIDHEEETAFALGSEENLWFHESEEEPYSWTLHSVDRIEDSRSSKGLDKLYNHGHGIFLPSNDKLPVLTWDAKKDDQSPSKFIKLSSSPGSEQFQSNKYSKFGFPDGKEDFQRNGHLEKSFDSKSEKRFYSRKFRKHKEKYHSNSKPLSFDGSDTFLNPVSSNVKQQVIIWDSRSDDQSQSGFVRFSSKAEKHFPERDFYPVGHLCKEHSNTQPEELCVFSFEEELQSNGITKDFVFSESTKLQRNSLPKRRVDTRSKKIHHSRRRTKTLDKRRKKRHSEKSKSSVVFLYDFKENSQDDQELGRSKGCPEYFKCSSWGFQHAQPSDDLKEPYECDRKRRRRSRQSSATGFDNKNCNQGACFDSGCHGRGCFFSDFQQRIFGIEHHGDVDSHEEGSQSDEDREFLEQHCKNFSSNRSQKRFSHACNKIRPIDSTNEFGKPESKVCFQSNWHPETFTIYNSKYGIRSQLRSEEPRESFSYDSKEPQSATFSKLYCVNGGFPKYVESRTIQKKEVFSFSSNDLQSDRKQEDFLSDDCEDFQSNSEQEIFFSDDCQEFHSNWEQEDFFRDDYQSNSGYEDFSDDCEDFQSNWEQEAFFSVDCEEDFQSNLEQEDFFDDYKEDFQSNWEQEGFLSDGCKESALSNCEQETFFGDDCEDSFQSHWEQGEFCDDCNEDSQSKWQQEAFFSVDCEEDFQSNLEQEDVFDDYKEDFSSNWEQEGFLSDDCREDAQLNREQETFFDDECEDSFQSHWEQRDFYDDYKEDSQSQWQQEDVFCLDYKHDFQSDWEQDDFIDDNEEGFQSNWQQEGFLSMGCRDAQLNVEQEAFVEEDFEDSFQSHWEQGDFCDEYKGDSQSNWQQEDFFRGDCKVDFQSDCDKEGLYDYQDNLQPNPEQENFYDEEDWEEEEFFHYYNRDLEQEDSSDDDY